MDAIRQTMELCHEVLTAYLGDLSDAELLIRPVPTANHIAWQLGHLIVSERQMLTALGQLVPELPPGFAAAYTRESAGSDDPDRFHSKDQYLTLLDRQREAALAALDALPEAELDKPAPEQMREYAPTVGAVFSLIGTHKLMHAGQFVTVRRKLGKPVLF